jgi:hypothetical protein
MPFKSVSVPRQKDRVAIEHVASSIFHRVSQTGRAHEPVRALE